VDAFEGVRRSTASDDVARGLRTGRITNRAGTPWAVISARITTETVELDQWRTDLQDLSATEPGWVAVKNESQKRKKPPRGLSPGGLSETAPNDGDDTRDR
jgi:hypothetical protein